MTDNLDFPSLHARVYPHNGRRMSLYEIGTRLSSVQLRQIAHNLRSRGYPVDRLEFYAYGPADTLRHLFVHWQNRKEPVPYFQLDTDVWQTVVEEILNVSDKA